jgi:hypothetical protein
MSIPLEEAQERRICRLCFKPISNSGGPKDAHLMFREMVFPEKVTFNFGKEFAHTDCLERHSKDIHGASGAD